MQSLGAECGQATVEAAALVPVVMLLLALLAQPVCVLYTKMLMSHAAAETARVVATNADEDVARDFALRRLEAVPEASLFHVGGTGDWVVDARREGDGGTVMVEISGHVRTLPLFGTLTSLLSEHDETGLVLRTRVCAQVRPTWVRGAYEDWLGMWR